MTVLSRRTRSLYTRTPSEGEIVSSVRDQVKFTLNNKIISSFIYYTGVVVLYNCNE